MIDLVKLAKELREKGDEHDRRRRDLERPASQIAHAVASAYYDAAAMVDKAEDAR